MKMRSAYGVVFLVFSLLGSPWLQALMAPGSSPIPTSAGVFVAGVVTNIDPVNMVIQIRQDSGMIQSIHMSDRIKILRNGSPVTFNSLSLGDSVTIVPNS